MVGRHVLGMPQTRAGRWSVRLAGAGTVCFGLLNLLVATGQRGGATFFDNPWLGLTALAALAGLLSGGAAALLAISRQGERAGLVWLILVGGISVLVFVAGELLAPH